MITKSTVPNKEWSAKNTNVSIEYSNINKQTTAIISAISLQRGIDLTMTFDNSVNILKFKEYLDELRRIYFFDDICIYMDNLSVHRSREIRDRMDDLYFGYVYGPPYSPDFNPIESVFSIFKRSMKN